MIHVAIRFDDPSLTSSRQVEAGLLASLERHSLNATFAVIPYSLINGEMVALTADAVPHLKSAADAGIIEIAQHGYCHKSWSVNNQGGSSEFFGVAADEQQRMIEAGAAQIARVFGITPSGFVPPWNSCDKNTIRILENSGFAYLSSAWDGALSDRIAMLPRSCNVFDIPKNIDALRASGFDDAVVIGIMHHYDFVEDSGSEAKRNLSDFDALLAWIKGQPDIQVMTLAHLATTRPASIWLRAYRTNTVRNYLPFRFQHNLPNGCLLPIPLMRAVVTGLLG